MIFALRDNCAISCEIVLFQNAKLHKIIELKKKNFSHRALFKDVFGKHSYFFSMDKQFFCIFAFPMVWFLSVMICNPYIIQYIVSQIGSNPIPRQSAYLFPV